MNKTNLIFTQNSLDKVNEVISKMEGNSFHNHYHILYDICNFFGKKNITYLEIGAYCGGSASLVSTNENVSKVYSIDIGRPINKEIPIRNVNKFKHSDCSYEYILGDSTSKNTVDYVNKNIKNIDVFFIDGDHRYSAVINDFEKYKNLVVKGGFIIFDDYMDSVHSPDVFHAVNDIVKSLNTEEYEIIGSLDYELLKLTNRPNIKPSNEFILRKK